VHNLAQTIRRLLKEIADLRPKDPISAEGIQGQYIQGFSNHRLSDRCTATLSEIGTAVGAPTDEEIADRSFLLFFSATSNSMSGNCSTARRSDCSQLAWMEFKSESPAPTRR
jgi:hypothetical protein